MVVAFIHPPVRVFRFVGLGLRLITFIPPQAGTWR
jgi:hypothetical protein